MVSVLTAAAMVGALIALVRRRRAGPHESLPPPARSALLAPFARLEVALDRAGAPRAPAESLSELGQRLAGEADLEGALAVVEQECYGGQRPSAAWTRAAVATLDAAASRLLAAPESPGPSSA